MTPAAVPTGAPTTGPPTPATTLRPADVRTAAAACRALVAPLQSALAAAVGAERRAAAGATPAAAQALRARADQTAAAVDRHLQALATLAGAWDTATAELLTQDAGLVRRAGDR